MGSECFNVKADRKEEIKSNVGIEEFKSLVVSATSDCYCTLLFWLFSAAR